VSGKIVPSEGTLEIFPVKKILLFTKSKISFIELHSGIVSLR